MQWLPGYMNLLNWNKLDDTDYNVIRGILKTQPNIYDGAFLRKQLTAKVFSQKSSIADIRMGSKYTFGNVFESLFFLKQLERV